MTYEVTRTSIIEQNPQEMNLNDRSNQLLNVKFCGEKYYFVIDNIEFQIISDIIQNLTETKLINFSNRKIFPSKMEKDDFDAQKEVMNFKNHFKSIIESDYFINNTITIISGYFIRRFYCPSNFFKRKIFKFQYEDVILESMLKNYFYYSKYKEDSESSHNILLYDVIKRILKNKIVDFGFKYELYHFIEDDFIIFRELSVTRNGIYKLVYYKKRNYLFAIKYILPNQSEKELQKEMNFCDNFKHRSFICFYGYLYRNETKIGFVYEFMSNGTLYDYINNKSNQKSQIWLLNSIARIYKGINYLYNNHLIHRDIKPQNILLNHDNLPFISDFETIRYINEDDDENQKEDLTGDIGSDSFASPEQHRNVKTSFSTDIYSFGLIVYFLYEEKSLWNCNYIYSNIFDFEQKKKKLENVDSNIKDIYESCVKFNPNERMKHADIMNKIIDELDAFDDFNQAFNKMSDFIEHFIQILYFISQRNDKENGIVNSLLKIYKYCNIYINKELVLNELELKETVSNTLIDFFNRSWKESVKKIQLKNKSFIFFAKAAAMLNNQKALLFLGNYYLYANVAPNEISGKQYLEMAIKYYNNPNALYILGKYLIENGREQNVSKGIKYLDLAAKQNHADSLFLLGKFYDIGIFFEQDSKRAMLYFELAAKQESYYYPNNFSIFENDPFIENISTTKSLCYYYLGIHYLHGDGIDEDLVIAKKIF